jgi:hypothetical protein
MTSTLLGKRAEDGANRGLALGLLGIKMVTPHTAVRFVRRLLQHSDSYPKPRRMWCVTCYRSPSGTTAPGWATGQHVYAGQAPCSDRFRV